MRLCLDNTEPFPGSLRVDPSLRETPSVLTSKRDPRVMGGISLLPRQAEGRQREKNPSCLRASWVSGNCLDNQEGSRGPTRDIINRFIKLGKGGIAPRTQEQPGAHSAPK